VLYTSLPVRNLEDAMVIVGYYEKRWLIEISHPVYTPSDTLYLRSRAA
jgi:hypothetical protein